MFGSIFKPALPTVQHVDLNKYLGTWYEIARMPFKAEDGLANITATYSLNEDNTIKVVNQGRVGSPNGELSRVEGKAWVEDKNTNAKLRV